MQAIILAGGQGQRLWPLTVAIPKPLLPVGDKPIMERLIEQLHRAGVKDIGVATGYRSELIQTYFQDGARLGVHLRYANEATKLGTAGPLAAFADWAQGPLIVVNGDILTTQDFGVLYAAHLDTAAEMTIGARRWALSLPYGVLDVEGGRLVEIREKPTVSFLINTGVYVVNPSVVTRIAPDQHLDMTDLISDLLAAGRRVDTFCIEAPWVDVGGLDDLAAAAKLVESWESTETPSKKGPAS